MSSDPGTLEDVIRLVAAQTGTSPLSIGASTRLAEDLGVDRDDAYDLLTAFASRFHVDLTPFEFSRHFGPEAGWNPFSYLCRGRLDSVTVGQLASAAENGVWSYGA